MSHEYYNAGYADWTRVTLYRLTGALEHMHLMIGTIAAHMRENEPANRGGAVALRCDARWVVSVVVCGEGSSEEAVTRRSATVGSRGIVHGS